MLEPAADRTPTLTLHQGALRCARPRSDAAYRLVCFPHAGGSAGFFRSWATNSPSDVEVWAVQLPGHEDRWSELPLTCMDDVLAELLPDLIAVLDRPTGLLGHSGGATIAYAALDQLRTRVPPSALHVRSLAVSARQSPTVAQRDLWHVRSDTDLLSLLDELGGPPALVTDPEDQRHLLAVLRADLQVVECWPPQRCGGGQVVPLVPEPLEVPVLVLAADQDPAVGLAEVFAWSEVTRGRFTVDVHPGGHFFLADGAAARTRVLDHLRAL